MNGGDIPFDVIIHIISPHLLPMSLENHAFYMRNTGKGVCMKRINYGENFHSIFSLNKKIHQAISLYLSPCRNQKPKFISGGQEKHIICPQHNPFECILVDYMINQISNVFYRQEKKKCFAIHPFDNTKLMTSWHQDEMLGSTEDVTVNSSPIEKAVLFNHIKNTIHNCSDFRFKHICCSQKGLMFEKEG